MKWLGMLIADLLVPQETDIVLDDEGDKRNWILVL